MEKATYEVSSISEFLAAWLTERPLSPANQKLVDDYYANFRGLRSPRMRFWYDNQVQEMEALIESLRNPRILEVGLGMGTETMWFAMLGADVTGIDVSPRSSRAAQERLDLLRTRVDRELKCRVANVSLLDFDDDQGFDIIWMEQAFHHLKPRAQIVDKLGALIRPGGYVVLSEANALNPLLQLQLFRARGLKLIVERETDYGTVLLGNERVLTARQLTRELEHVGILKQAIRYFRVFLSHVLFDRFFELEKSAAGLGFPPIYSHYNFVGRKLH